MPGRKNRAPRVRARLDVMFVYDRVDSTGTIVDISRSGAQIAAQARRIPPVGAPIRLFIAAGAGRAVEIGASVVRHTEAGFGVCFAACTSELLHLLVDLGGSALPPETT